MAGYTRLASSAHGLATALTSPTIKGRIFWSLVFAIATLFVAYNISVMITDFYKRDITVDYALYGGYVPFPAVTLCSLNNIKRSALGMVPKLVAMQKVYNMMETEMLDEWNQKKRKRRSNLISKRNIACANTTCAGITNVTNGSVYNMTSTCENVTVQISCDPGYSPTTQNTFLTCDAISGWDYPTPDCVKLCYTRQSECSAIPAMASLLGNEYCYYMVNATGSWDDNMNQCNSSGNGRLATGLGYNALYHIAKVHQISGHGRWSFRINGKRNASTSKVLSNYMMYDTPVTPLGVTANEGYFDRRPNGMSGTWRCLKIGPASSIILGAGCGDTTVMPFCEKYMPCTYECETIANISGVVVYSSTPIIEGVVATITCFPGFYETGSKNVTCIERGLWDRDPSHVCVPTCTSREIECNSHTGKSYFVHETQRCYILGMGNPALYNLYMSVDYCFNRGMQLAVFRTAEELFALDRFSEFYPDGTFYANGKQTGFTNGWNMTFYHFTSDDVYYGSDETLGSEAFLNGAMRVPTSGDENTMVSSGSNSHWCFYVKARSFDNYFPTFCYVRRIPICEKYTPCQSTCPPINIHMGSVNYSVTARISGTNAIIHCNENFSLSHTDTVVCGSAGKWIQPIPRCDPICWMKPRNDSCSAINDHWGMSGDYCFVHQDNLTGTYFYSMRMCYEKFGPGHGRLAVPRNDMELAAIYKTMMMHGNPTTDEEWYMNGFKTSYFASNDYSSFKIYDDYNKPATAGVLTLAESYFPVMRGGVTNKTVINALDIFNAGHKNITTMDITFPGDRKFYICEFYMPCAKGCQQLVIANGTVNITANYFRSGTMVDVTCGPGFALIGTNPVNCTESGTWEPLPQCQSVSSTSPSTTSTAITTTTNVITSTNMATETSTNMAATTTTTSIYDACSDAPCFNGGTCHSNGTRDRWCTCPPSYDAITNCETLIDECSDQNPCVNAGCYLVDGKPACSCTDGWRGLICDQETDECADLPCYPTAQCNDLHFDFSCTCQEGMTGLLCDQHIDECESNPCDQNETCTDYINGYSCLSSDMVSDMKAEVLALLAEYDLAAADDLATLLTKTDTQASKEDQLAQIGIPKKTPQSVKDEIDVMLGYILMQIDQEILYKTGFSLPEILMWCTYDEASDCQWDKFYHHQYGNCYTFNNNASIHRKTVRAGQQYGLTLAVHVNSDDYMTGTQAQGFRFAIHEPGVVPFPDFNGFSVMPGFFNAYALIYNDQSALGPPYGTCISSPEEIDPFYYDGGYSVPACEFSYKQKKIYEQCLCYNTVLPKPKNTNVSSCNLTDKVCVDNIIQNTSIVGEHCKHACRAELFTVTSTKSRKLTATNLNCDEPKNKQRCKKIKNSGVINLYYGSLTRISMTERPLYTIPSLLSNIGGIMGLLTGFSAITFVEFGFLIGDLCQFTVRKIIGILS